MMEWEYELLISPLGPSINFLSALPHSEMNCKVTHTHRFIFFIRNNSSFRPWKKEITQLEVHTSSTIGRN